MELESSIPPSAIWEPWKARALPSDRRENPWSRDGSQARAARAFLEPLRGRFNYEEAEDWEVLNPPRPARSWVDSAPTWSDFFDVELFQAICRDDAEADHASGEFHRPRRRVKSWTVTLEDNYDALLSYDESIERVEDHWYLVLPSGLRIYRPTAIVLLDTTRRPRRVPAVKAAWLIEHESVSQNTDLVSRCGSGCLAPDHHTERRR